MNRGPGWWNESQRHSLASRGVKSTRKLKKIYPWEKAGNVNEVPDIIIERMPHFELNLIDSKEGEYYIWADGKYDLLRGERSSHPWNVLSLRKATHDSSGEEIWILERKQHMGGGKYIILSENYFKTLPRALYNVKNNIYSIGPNVIDKDELEYFFKTGHYKR